MMEAQDIKEPKKSAPHASHGSRPFSDDEMMLLSDGLLSMIRNAEQVKKITDDPGIHSAAEEAMDRYRKLNKKVCCMAGDAGKDRIWITGQEK